MDMMLKIARAALTVQVLNVERENRDSRGQVVYIRDGYLNQREMEFRGKQEAFPSILEIREYFLPLFSIFMSIM
jgi:hypothetical protein